MTIRMSARTEFTATHLEPETKQRLQLAAWHLQMSMSEFIAQAVKEKLARYDRRAQLTGQKRDP